MLKVKMLKESSILTQAKRLVDEELDAAEKTILERWRNHVGTTKLKQLPIDDKSKQNLLTIRLRMFYDESDAMVQRMYTGDITLGDFQEQFKGLIREFHTSAAAIGKGGWELMSNRDWGRLGTPLREQYSWLKGFIEYIDENRDTASFEQLRARARLYGDGAIRAAILTEAGFTIADLLPFLPKDGSTECLNRCHCKWMLEVTGKQGNFQIVRAVWVLGEADHCKTCKARDGYTEIIRVPIDVEVPSVIGGY